MASEKLDLLTSLEALRESYEDMGVDATRLLRMVPNDMTPFVSARAAALEESGVNSVITEAKNGTKPVSEQDVRDFMVVHREGIVRACAEMRVFKEIDPEQIWKEEIQELGLDKFLDEKDKS